MRKIRILLTDEHQIVRESIRRLLEHESDLEVVGEAADGREAFALTLELTPDVVVVDIAPGDDGDLEIVRQIRATDDAAEVLVLTGCAEDQHMMACLEAGAHGYLLRNISPEVLVDAIRAVRSGIFVFHPAIVGKLMPRTVNRKRASESSSSDTGTLTPREAAVLKLAASGMSNRNIARELNVEVSTVKTHLMNVFSKLRVGSRTEAVLVALKRKWIDLEDFM